MKGIILTGVGFGVGVFEALIYYNIGQSEGGKFKFRIPPTKEFVITGLTVFATSLITTALFKAIELAMDANENQDPAEKETLAKY